MAHLSKPVRPNHTSTTSTLLLLLLALLLSPSAAQTSPFTDQATGIQFQRFFGARTNFAFGIALPQTPSTSFIGQLSFPLVNGAGWGGWSLTGDMEGPLLMAAWSDGKGGVVSSFRQASNEDDSPPEVTGNFTVRPIAEATAANNTFLTYTFLCEGCVAAGLGLNVGATTAEMGWALASRAVRNPGSSAGVLAFHNSGLAILKPILLVRRMRSLTPGAALAGGPRQPAAGARAFNAASAGGGDDGDGGDASGGDDGDSDSDDDD